MISIDAGTSARPTTLKPVIDVVPERCYEKSTVRGLGLVARDLALYGVAVVGLLATDRWYLLVPLWLLAGVAASGLFVLGHDAAHGSLFESARIPCYRLPDAARAIRAAFPDEVIERPIRVRSYLRSVQACKLHDSRPVPGTGIQPADRTGAGPPGEGRSG